MSVHHLPHCSIPLSEGKISVEETREKSSEITEYPELEGPTRISDFNSCTGQPQKSHHVLEGIVSLFFPIQNLLTVYSAVYC